MYFDQVSLASTYTGQIVLVTAPLPEFYKPKHSRLCLHCNSYFMVVYVGSTLVDVLFLYALEQLCSYITPLNEFYEFLY